MTNAARIMHACSNFPIHTFMCGSLRACPIYHKVPFYKMLEAAKFGPLLYVHMYCTILPQASAHPPILWFCKILHVTGHLAKFLCGDLKVVSLFSCTMHLYWASLIWLSNKAQAKQQCELLTLNLRWALAQG